MSKFVKVLLLTIVTFIGIILGGCEVEETYTKEEVDLMLEEKMELMQNVIWEIEDDVYVYRDDLEKQLSTDYYTKNEIDDGFEDAFVEIEQRLYALENIEELGNEELLANLAMANVLIYMYENNNTEPTEQDILMYETLLAFREETRKSLLE